MIRLGFVSVAMATGTFLAPQKSGSLEMSETEFLENSPVVQELAHDEDMVQKLHVLASVMRDHENLSLLQVAPGTADKAAVRIRSAEDAVKELSPVLSRMQSLDPKGAHMLQSIIQMVGALAQSQKSAVKSNKNKKQAFMQLGKNSGDDHDSNMNKSFISSSESGTSPDPAVMEERLMRIQPILLRLKQLNGKEFGGLANVVDKAERHAEDEVVNGSFK